MRVMVLGAGLQGAACAYDLLSTSDATVTMADISIENLPTFLSPFSDRLHTIVLDARDASRAKSSMEGHNVVLSALPYYFNADMARFAVECGAHYADLGGNTEIVREQEKLEDLAKSARVTVVPDCGLAPGMVNILAYDGIKRLDTVESARLFVGGLPQNPNPPLNYQIVYSLEGALDYYTTPSWVVRDGKPVEMEALSEVEDQVFDDPVGRLEAFHTAGGLSTMAWEFGDKVRTMEYKTLRYPGHADIMRAIRDLGLLGLDPIPVKGTKVTPRDVFIRVVDPVLRKPEGRDLVALRVFVAGHKAGRPTTHVYTVLDKFDEQRGISAMMRTTAYSLSMTGQMLARGEMIGGPGVRPSYLATPGEAYMDGLHERGIIVHHAEQ